MSIATTKHLKIFLFVTILAILSYKGFDVTYANNLPTPQKMGLPFESTAKVENSIGKIIRQAIMFTGVLAIMSLTYAGILMMLSYGDENKVKNAKSIITYSLIGILLSGAAYAIIEAIYQLNIS
jgi:hypothetical protein